MGHETRVWLNVFPLIPDHDEGIGERVSFDFDEVSQDHAHTPTLACHAVDQDSSLLLVLARFFDERDTFGEVVDNLDHRHVIDRDLKVLEVLRIEVVDLTGDIQNVLDPQLL